jgi:2'-5' RNA ligase
MHIAPSLILTVGLDKESQHFFSQLRNQYYPAHCNYVDAHITLLHRLPAGIALFDESMHQLTKQHSLQIEVNGITNIGKGIIFNLYSPDLQALHKNLKAQFTPFLISKDRRAFVPHITIQNRVTAYKAAQTFQSLTQQFKPFVICGEGIAVWQYLKGPWQLLQFYPFY